MDPWPTTEICGCRFAQDGKEIIVNPIGPADLAAFVEATKSALDPLTCQIAFHGLAAQRLHLAEVSLSDGSVHRPGTFDIRLTDPRSFTGFSDEPAFDLSDARDYVVREILAVQSPLRSDELAADITLSRAVEAFLRAIVKPSAVLQNLYLSLEHIQKKLGSRSEFVRIGITKDYVDYVMMRANALPDSRSRHAPIPGVQLAQIPAGEVHECLRRTRHVLVSYAAKASK